jgi:hypothetical protein
MTTFSAAIFSISNVFVNISFRRRTPLAVGRGTWQAEGGVGSGVGRLESHRYNESELLDLLGLLVYHCLEMGTLTACQRKRC